MTTHKPGASPGTASWRAVPRARVPAGDDAVVQVADGRWERRFKRLVVGADATVVALAVAGGAGVASWAEPASSARDHALVALGVGALILACLAVRRSWETARLGAGSEEYYRVARGVLLAAIVLALIAVIARTEALRPWVLEVLPVVAVALLLSRYLLRQELHRRRRAGRCLHPVLVVGSPDGVADLIETAERAPHQGWWVTVACTSTGRAADESTTIRGVTVAGDLDAVAEVARTHRVRRVAVATAPGWGASRLRRLSWELEGSGVELMVDPGLMEVAGPRVHVEPVDGNPLLRVTEPRFSGTARLVKAVADRVVAVLLAVVLFPVLLAVAAAVACDGRPVLYRQTRVGLAGRPFTILKFRTMVDGADVDLEHLRALNDCDGPRFKLRVDPRSTRTGAWLRRWSLDELPQLLNVVAGSMSLVGPRPPLPSEVAEYSPEALRRLLVRPGLTGLWQVSGRADLSWEASLRLDLRYVENWTPLLDLAILWKTVWAIVRGTGAY